MGDFCKKGWPQIKLSRAQKVYASYIACLVTWLFIDVLLYVRLLIGPRSACRFDPSCTTYALNELKQKPFLQALGSISRRLLSCVPGKATGSRVIMMSKAPSDTTAKSIFVKLIGEVFC